MPPRAQVNNPHTKLAPPGKISGGGQATRADIELIARALRLLKRATSAVSDQTRTSGTGERRRADRPEHTRSVYSRAPSSAWFSVCDTRHDYTEDEERNP